MNEFNYLIITYKDGSEENIAVDEVLQKDGNLVITKGNLVYKVPLDKIIMWNLEK